MSQKDRRKHPIHWPEVSKFTIALTRGRCCNCWFKPAVDAHHAYYGIGLMILRLFKAWLEIPGWQVFPLCRQCHGFYHRAVRYLEFKNNWKNRNTQKAAMVLRARFLALFLIVWLWWIPFLIGSVYLLLYKHFPQVLDLKPLKG